MHIVCIREDLLNGIQQVFSAVSTKSSLPVLSNILFEITNKGKLKLSATDLEISITTEINAEVHTKGTTTIPAKRLMDIVREVNGKEIEIKVKEGEKIDIKCGKAHFALVGIAKDDFPAIPEVVHDDSEVTLQKELIKAMIQKTSFAVSYDESRYVLNGVFFEVARGMVIMVATDGRRLAFMQGAIPGLNKNIGISIIIPTKTITEMNKLFGMVNAEHITITVKDNQIACTIGSTVMISRLIDGNFPNYEQVIPKKSDARIVMNKEELFAVTRRVALMSIEKEKMNFIKYTFRKNKLYVTAASQGIGEADDEMDVVYDKPEIEMAYNPTFIMDVLRNIEEEKVVLEVTTALNPGVLKPENNTSYLCVVMPVRLS